MKKNSAAFIKKLLFSAFLTGVLCCPLLTFAQSFNKATQLYHQKKYKAAVAILDTLNTPEAHLFAGKCYFALGQYRKASGALNKINRTADAPISYEAYYTSALVEFRQKKFGNALNHLYAIQKNVPHTSVSNEAGKLYQQILNYLAPQQRLRALSEAQTDEIKFDITQSAVGKADYKNLIKIFNNAQNDIKTSKLQTKIKQMQSSIGDSASYARHYNPGQALTPPDGTVYNIGVALPDLTPDHNEFSTVQGLYLGFLLAIKNYNKQHDHVKAVLDFKDTGMSKTGADSAMEAFSQQHVDAILGPLFSRQAEAMASLTRRYHIPVIAPLSNSDLDTYSPYLYQANPTFTVHGKDLAKYAVQDLHLKKFAVIAGQNTLGASSAYAFRKEALKLGAKIPYFYVENLKGQGYELSSYTQFLGLPHESSDHDNENNSNDNNTNTQPPDTTEHVDAIYAPFTGEGASTLIDMLLVDLKAKDTLITVLGSKEWKQARLSKDQLQNIHIYYSEGFHETSHQAAVTRFKQDYYKKFNLQPNVFSQLGYDVAHYLLQTIDKVGNPALLKTALKKQPVYKGLVDNIHFAGKNINQQIKIMQIGAQNNQLVNVNTP